jgi:hypothetical protein
MKSVRFGLMLALAIASSCGGKTDVSHQSIDGGMAGSAGWASISCMHGDVPMRVGEAYNQSDCVSCQCKASGEIICSEIDCNPGCGDAYGAYLLGAVFPDPRSCGTCTCGMDGIVRCSPSPCLASCTYAGQSHPSGEDFISPDGCNSCSCSNGAVNCTSNVCPCEPMREYYRSYLSLGADGCPTTDLACQTGATPFTNECGCGCEQSLSCPQYFDCRNGVASGGAAGSLGGADGAGVPNPYGSTASSMGGTTNAATAGSPSTSTAGTATLAPCPTPEQRAMCPLSEPVY